MTAPARYPYAPPPGAAQPRRRRGCLRALAITGAVVLAVLISLIVLSQLFPLTPDDTASPPVAVPTEPAQHSVAWSVTAAAAAGGEMTSPQWETGIDGDWTGSVTLTVGDTILAMVGDGHEDDEGRTQRRLVSLDPADGRVRWSSDLADAVCTNIDDTRIVCVGGAGRVTVLRTLDVATGAVLTPNVPVTIVAPRYIFATDSHVIVIGEEGDAAEIVALTTTGEELWRQDLHAVAGSDSLFSNQLATRTGDPDSYTLERVRIQPLRGGGLLLISPPAAAPLDPDTGVGEVRRCLYSTPTPDGGFACAEVADDQGRGGMISAYAADGALRWEAPDLGMARPDRSDPVPIAFREQNSAWVDVDWATGAVGEVRERFPRQDRTVWGMTLTDWLQSYRGGGIDLLGTASTLERVADDGTLWRWDVPSESESIRSAAVVNGAVIVNGTYGLDGETGSLLWERSGAPDVEPAGGGLLATDLDTLRMLALP